MRKHYLLAPIAGIALLVAGCGGDADEAQAPAQKTPVASKPAPSQPEMPSVDSGATLTVRSPEPGTVVTRDKIPFGVELANFKVDCRFSPGRRTGRASGTTTRCSTVR